MSKFTDLLLLDRHLVTGKEYENLVEKFHNENDEDEASFIGALNLDITEDDIDLLEERALGDINFGNKVGNVSITLRLREGWEKPHMHLEGKNFHCAIRLDKAEYFIHNPYNHTLNSKQAKLFNDFMKTKSKGTFITRWEYAVTTFNNEFPDHIIDITKQPNYNKLKEK